MFCDNCRTAKISMDSHYIYINNKKVPYKMFYSSSNNLYPQYHEKRKEEWKTLIDD